MVDRQINIASGTQYTAINPVNIFYSTTIRKDQKQFAFTWMNNNIHLNFFLRAMLMLLPSVIVLRKNDSPKRSTPSGHPTEHDTNHYIHDTMVTEQKQEVVCVLEASVRCMLL